MSAGQKKYEKFIEIFKKAHPCLTKETQFKNGQELWRKVKGNEQELEKTIIELKAKEANAKASMVTFWAKMVSIVC